MTEWIAIVDDDPLNLRTASLILGKNGMRVTALHAGQALLDWIGKDHTPDLILLDIMMPQMDGFETLKRLRRIEEENAMEPTPVIFLTGDSDAEIETKGLSAGALDFIRKPFEANALVHRVRNIVSQSERMKKLAIDSRIDKMTGFLNKTVATETVRELCRTLQGVLIVCDLDCFKLINDLYGHDVGDRILTAFADAVRNAQTDEDVLGRIGGDEFMIFSRSLKDADSVRVFVEELNRALVKKAEELTGENVRVGLGVSAGCIMVPHGNKEYHELFKLADMALYHVKQNGKHGCAFAEDLNLQPEDDIVADDMQSISMALAEREELSHAMWIGEDAFREIYRFMMRYIQSYNGVAYKVLFTLIPQEDGKADADEMSNACFEFGKILQNTLRKSDIMMQIGANRFFLLLPELEEQYAGNVMDRIRQIWQNAKYADRVNFTYELKSIGPDHESGLRRRDDGL